MNPSLVRVVAVVVTDEGGHLLIDISKSASVSPFLIRVVRVSGFSFGTA